MMEKAINKASVIALIDDDPLIRATWSMVAKDQGHKLHCFASIEEFDRAQLAPETSVYVDYHLGTELGTRVAKALWHKGYQSLYITTGSDPDEIPTSTEIKGVQGKAYPLRR